MKRAFYLNPPACTSKYKETQAITIMKLIFDTDAKKLMKGILVLQLACVRHSYMQLQFTAIYLAKKCSLKFQLIYLQFYVFKGREVAVIPAIYNTICEKFPY